MITKGEFINYINRLEKIEKVHFNLNYIKSKRKKENEILLDSYKYLAEELLEELVGDKGNRVSFYLYQSLTQKESLITKQKLYDIISEDNNRKIYIIGDTHFNHKRIIEYCNRPYKNVDEMNEDMINKWNSVVTNNDIVIHVGDFGLGSFEELKKICDRLNGIKYLIMGNHDLRGGNNFYSNLGFYKIYKKELRLDNYVFSHKPKSIDNNSINIYGHIHNSSVPVEFNDNKHICVSVERINYTPIEISELIGDAK